MNYVLEVVKSALKLLILGWVVVYDKYKTALVSDPRHRIALIDFLRPESPRPAVSGFQGQRKSTRVRFSYCNKPLAPSGSVHQQLSN
jgi:hypothetical protein